MMILIYIGGAMAIFFLGSIAIYFYVKRLEERCSNFTVDTFLKSNDRTGVEAKARFERHHKLKSVPVAFEYAATEWLSLKNHPGYEKIFREYLGWCLENCQYVTDFYWEYSIENTVGVDPNIMVHGMYSLTPKSNFKTAFTFRDERLAIAFKLAF